MKNSERQSSVKFVHHDLVLKAERELFRVWQCPDSTVREFLSYVPLTRDSRVFLVGPPGSGKSSLIQGIHIVYFGGEKKHLGQIQCDSSLMPDDVLYRLDLGELTNKGIEKAYPRKIVTSEIKWIQEPTLANTTLQNAFLYLLAEKESSYRDQIFRSPDYICLGDFNPSELGGVASQMRWPFVDRWDAEVHLSDLPLLSLAHLILLKYSKGHSKDLRNLFHSVMKFDHVKEVWADVERVSVPEEFSIFTSMFIKTFTSCLYDSERISAIYKSKCLDGVCEFRNEFCSMITRPILARAADATICFAKARAWHSKRTEISVEDVLFCLPFTLNHRLVLKSDFAQRWKSTFDFAVEAVETIRKNKFANWNLAAEYYDKVVNKGEVSELSKLEDLGKRDLAIRAIHANAKELSQHKTQSQVKTIKDEIEDMKQRGYTYDDVVSVRKKVHSMNLIDNDKSDLTMQLDTLIAGLSCSSSLTQNAYGAHFIPWLTNVSPDLAKKLVPPKTGTYSKDGLEIKIEVPDRETYSQYDKYIDITAKFADSKQADDFRGKVV